MSFFLFFPSKCCEPNDNNSVFLPQQQCSWEVVANMFFFAAGGKTVTVTKEWKDRRTGLFVPKYCLKKGFSVLLAFFEKKHSHSDKAIKQMLS